MKCTFWDFGGKWASCSCSGIVSGCLPAWYTRFYHRRALQMSSPVGLLKTTHRLWCWPLTSFSVTQLLSPSVFFFFNYFMSIWASSKWPVMSLIFSFPFPSWMVIISMSAFLPLYLLSRPCLPILASPSAILWDTIGRKGCLKYINALGIFWILAVMLNAVCCALCSELKSVHLRQVCFSVQCAAFWFL